MKSKIKRNNNKIMLILVIVLVCSLHYSLFFTNDNITFVILTVIQLALAVLISFYTDIR
jgi:hypothetical protein